MKALSLHGAWAHYDQQNANQASRIAWLEGEVQRCKEESQQLREALRESQQEQAVTQQQDLPRLRDENQRARHIITELECELQAAKDVATAATSDRDAQLTVLQDKIQQLTADNTLLKQELAKSVQVRANTHSKLDEARRRLGLSASEAQVFVKEFDEACRSNAQLRKEVVQLQSERSDLQQQCENRSQHCMTLIAENKRLTDQVAELRRQTVELDQTGWKLRQQITAATQRQQNLQHKREVAAAATKGRPQWQSRDMVKPARLSSVSPEQNSAQQAKPKTKPCLAAAEAHPFTKPALADVTNAMGSDSAMPSPPLSAGLQILALHNL